MIQLMRMEYLKKGLAKQEMLMCVTAISHKSFEILKYFFRECSPISFALFDVKSGLFVINSLRNVNKFIFIVL